MREDTAQFRRRSLINSIGRISGAALILGKYFLPMPPYRVVWPRAPRHTVPAGHSAFLAPCSPQLAAAVPRICTDDPAGFDRVAFHRDFNASVEMFFRERLVGDGGMR